MTPTDEELESAKENVRNLFFALAFDPDNPEAARQADEALRELDRMLGADVPDTAGR
jgi:hypothetical protein